MCAECGTIKKELRHCRGGLWNSTDYYCSLKCGAAGNTRYSKPTSSSCFSRAALEAAAADSSLVHCRGCREELLPPGVVTLQQQQQQQARPPPAQRPQTPPQLQQQEVRPRPQQQQQQQAQPPSRPQQQQARPPPPKKDGMSSNEKVWLAIGAKVLGAVVTVGVELLSNM